MVREAIAWLDRTLPLSARFPKGAIPASATSRPACAPSFSGRSTGRSHVSPPHRGRLHRTDAIEVWGRGTNRVIEACRAYGIAEPTFTEGSGAVTVTFKADVVADLGTKPHAGPSDATLTERQQAILRALEQKPAMPLREISAALEEAPSDRRLREELLHLKQRGLVEQSGHGRGSSWSRRRRAE
jgi:predicted HTH transcriptional regulator